MQMFNRKFPKKQKEQMRNETQQSKEKSVCEKFAIN